MIRAVSGLRMVLAAFALAAFAFFMIAVGAASLYSGSSDEK